MFAVVIVVVVVVLVVIVAAGGRGLPGGVLVVDVNDVGWMMGFGLVGWLYDE